LILLYVKTRRFWSTEVGGSTYGNRKEEIENRIGGKAERMEIGEL